MPFTTRTFSKTKSPTRKDSTVHKSNQYSELKTERNGYLNEIKKKLAAIEEAKLKSEAEEVMVQDTAHAFHTAVKKLSRKKPIRTKKAPL